MVECSVKTELNGKPFIYRYGIAVDEIDTGGRWLPRVVQVAAARNAERAMFWPLLPVSGKGYE